MLALSTARTPPSYTFEIAFNSTFAMRWPPCFSPKHLLVIRRGYFMMSEYAEKGLMSTKTGKKHKKKTMCLDVWVNNPLHTV
jgi:hypothetical protein